MAIYSHTTNRLWRKTRSRYDPSNSCIGTDPNRNWGFHWGEGDSTLRRYCASIYAGPSAFSEIEVRSMADYLDKLNTSLQMYISLHAYGQIILGPWGFMTKLPDNYLAQKDAADAAVEAIRRTTNASYSFGTISNLLYRAAGTSIDYLQHKGVPYIFGFELRPVVEGQGESAFVQPTTQISPTGREFYAALRALISHIVVARQL